MGTNGKALVLSSNSLLNCNVLGPGKSLEENRSKRSTIITTAAAALRRKLSKCEVGISPPHLGTVECVMRVPVDSLT